jgi:hypothetical protein
MIYSITARLWHLSLLNLHIVYKAYKQTFQLTHISKTIFATPLYRRLDLKSHRHTSNPDLRRRKPHARASAPPSWLARLSPIALTNHKPCRKKIFPLPYQHPTKQQKRNQSAMLFVGIAEGGARTLDLEVGCIITDKSHTLYRLSYPGRSDRVAVAD